MTDLPTRATIFANCAGAPAVSSADGHHVAGTFVVARRVNVGYGNTPQFWDKQQSEQFTWTTVH
jgi:hypothetical protein